MSGITKCLIYPISFSFLLHFFLSLLFLIIQHYNNNTFVRKGYMMYDPGHKFTMIPKLIHFNLNKLLTLLIQIALFKYKLLSDMVYILMYLLNALNA